MVVAFNQVSFDDAYCQLPATGKPVERKLNYNYPICSAKLKATPSNSTKMPSGWPA